MLTLPNILTLARLALLPLIIALFFLEVQLGSVAAWMVFWLYVVGAITDFLDGYLARKYNLVSAFGTFLDPIADKVFVAAMLVLLVGFGRLDGLWMVAVIIILSREFLVSGLREFLGPKNVQLPVTKLAKWKTTLQMVAIGLLILGPYVAFTMLAGQWALACAAVITLVTGWQYMQAGLEHMREKA